jgi:hypothetical protein
LKWGFLVLSPSRKYPTSNLDTGNQIKRSDNLELALALKKAATQKVTAKE